MGGARARWAQMIREVSLSIFNVGSYQRIVRRDEASRIGRVLFKSKKTKSESGGRCPTLISVGHEIEVWETPKERLKSRKTGSSPKRFGDLVKERQKEQVTRALKAYKEKAVQLGAEMVRKLSMLFLRPELRIQRIIFFRTELFGLGQSSF